MFITICFIIISLMCNTLHAHQHEWFSNSDVLDCVHTSSTPLNLLLCLKPYFYGKDTINEQLWSELLPTAEQNTAFSQVK
jgi:hypothetical protein